jgi:hypothetical protein
MIKDFQIIDNFYDDPNSIISKFQEYCYNTHICPGLRSVQLFEIDTKFYEEFSSFVCSLHNIDRKKVDVWTYFNLQTYDESKPECLNYAWPHVDGNIQIDDSLTHENYKENMLFGGVIYLTENPDPETGLTFYKKRESCELTDKELFYFIRNNYLAAKLEYDEGKVSVDELNRRYKEYYDMFDMTLEIKNQFNRMTTWRCGNIRGSKFISKQPTTRLVHSFYITNKR